MATVKQLNIFAKSIPSLMPAFTFVKAGIFTVETYKYKHFLPRFHLKEPHGPSPVQTRSFHVNASRSYDCKTRANR